MRIRWRKRRGSAWAWVVALISIFTLGIFYIIYFHTYYILKDQISSTPAFNFTLPTKAQEVINFGELVMGWLPFFFYIGILAWAIVYSLTKRERTDIFGG